MEIMPTIPNGSIDMILCDLPYGVTCNKWDTPLPMKELWEQYKRIIKQNGAIVLTAQQPFTTDLINGARDIFRYTWVWAKANAKGHLNANRKPLRAHEDVLIFYKKLPTYNPQSNKMSKKVTRDGRAETPNYGHRVMVSTPMGMSYPTSIIKINNGTFEAKEHPTEKPVALMEYLIRTYSNEHDTILDNCMGAGSTGIACANTNRKFIGIELNEYFDIAKQRIEEAYKRGKTLTKLSDWTS